MLPTWHRTSPYIHYLPFFRLPATDDTRLPSTYHLPLPPHPPARALLLHLPAFTPPLACYLFLPCPLPFLTYPDRFGLYTMPVVAVDVRRCAVCRLVGLVRGWFGWLGYVPFVHTLLHRGSPPSSYLPYPTYLPDRAFTTTGMLWFTVCLVGA